MSVLNFFWKTLTERILIKTRIGTKIIKELEVESELNLFKNGEWNFRTGTGTGIGIPTLEQNRN